MANATRSEYNRIINKIAEARRDSDYKAVKRWERKLEKWQEAYGAYAPIR